MSLDPKGLSLVADAGEVIIALRRDLADARAEVERLTMELDRRHHDKVAAELRAEGLRVALANVRLEINRLGFNCDGATEAHWIAIRALGALGAVPPRDLSLLRELTRAVRRWDEVRLSSCQEDIGNSEMGLGAALDAALAAYPFLDPGADPPAEATE